MYRTFATASQLIPSSSSSNAFARRVRRVSAFPSRTSAMRSSRVVVSRKLARIMPLTRITPPYPGKRFFVQLLNRGILHPKGRPPAVSHAFEVEGNRDARGLLVGFPHAGGVDLWDKSCLIPSIIADRGCP